MISRMASLAAGLLLLSAIPAGAATVSFDFLSSLLTTQPGRTVTFSGTLVNTGSSTAYLNGDSFTFPLPVDDTPFFAGAPLSLAPGQSYTGQMIGVTVPPGTPLGLYVGVFNITGGDTPSQFDVLASRDFGVQVVPEPSTAAGLLGGALAIALLRRFRTGCVRACGD